MRRGNGWALFCVVLIGCLQAIGCGGGGTPALKVTTTSLSSGTVGAPYVQTLTATGGTPSYTWSQLSGGAMPAGVSLANTGAFNGAPQAAGTFGPYVFQVTDSTGIVASSPSMSIKITSTTLGVITNTLPQGTVSTAYSVTLAAAGGTPPYTWTETSGGALPPGLTNITGAGLIAGTPTTAGTYGPYVFTVTDSTSATAASGSLSVTISNPVASCAPLGNEAALTAATPYAFLVKGSDSSGNPIDIAGSFTPNGSGGIINATVDYNGFSNGPAQFQVNLAASSYAFGASTAGCLALAFTGPTTEAGSAKHVGAAPQSTRGALAHGDHRGRLRDDAAAALVPTSVQFAFGLGGFDGTVYNTGRIIEYDYASSGTSASGFMQVQIPSAFSLTSLQPNYAFGVDGWAADASGLLRTAIAGSFTNASGALSAGYADMNSGGTPSGELTGGSGTLNSAIDPTTGRGTGTYTIPTSSGNLTFDFAFYVLNGTDFILLSSDSPITVGAAPLLSGRALASSVSYATGALNGYYLLASQGLEVTASGSGNLAAIGTLNATSAGTIPTATLYVNDAGTYSSTPYTGATYAVEAASGRVSVGGLTVASPVVYLTAGNSSDDQIAGFLIGTDSEASDGVIVYQSTSTPAYIYSDLSGYYSVSNQEDLDALNGAYLGTFLFSGTNQYSAIQKSTGLLRNLTSPGTLNLNPDGSGSLNNSSLPFVTNGSVIFAIPSSGDPLIYVFTEGTLPN